MVVPHPSLFHDEPEALRAGLAHLRALADAGNGRRALALAQDWLRHARLPPLLQAYVRLLRDQGVGPETLEAALRELARHDALQSWRDVATLAELDLKRGRIDEAKRCLEAALQDLRGRPRLEEARQTLRDLLARAEHASVQPAPRTRPAPVATKPAGPPPSAPARAEPPAPSLPPPEDAVEVPVAITIEAAPALAAAFARGGPPGHTTDDRAALLRAHAIAVADRFDDLLCLPTMRGVTRMSHQIETVKRALRALRGRALLADEVGLGKTIEAGMFFAEARLRGLVRAALVLVPASLVGQWREELRAKFGLEVATTEDDAFRADPEGFWARQPLVVASLEMARSRRHADYVVARRWDLVIVDEAHRLKNRDTLGWKLCDRLVSRFLLLLSATPVENDLTELWGVINLLRPGQLATLAEFKRRFVDRRDPARPREVDALRALLGEVMIRNTRALADVRLPPRFARTVRVAASPEERALYARIRALVAERYAHADERLSGSTLLEEAGSSPFAVRDTCARMLERPELAPELAAALREVAALARAATATGKAATLTDIVRAAGAAGEKTVVFSRYRATLTFLADTLRAHGMRYATLHGGISGPEKDAAAAEFAEDTGILLCSEVGAEGRNLQVASTLVNFDLPWNPMRLEQRIGRLHRIGQTREVHVHNLCAAESAEERILDVLDRRINLFELVIGELDLILGRLEDARDFGARVTEIYGTARNDDDVAKGFTRLGDELEAARRGYGRTKDLDRQLFGTEFEV